MVGEPSTTLWQKDKAWSDRFLPEIKAILGLHLIGEPPVEEDAQRNTDLIVLRMDAVRIACRVRNHDYLRTFGDEFTIRSSRPSQIKTELAKIVEGWGDYYFYGFSDAHEVSLAAWFIGDLKIFRLWFTYSLLTNQGNLPGSEQSNADGSSGFVAFKVNDLPAKFVMASMGHRPRSQSLFGD